MSTNINLHKAKNAKNDEFYTRLEDIKKELIHYKQHFKDKIVLCNCDDPKWSNFWKYFHLNFSVLGLKKLISTHYNKNESTYKMEYVGGNDNDIEIGVKTLLEGNGDFRNQECVEILKEADIVVTNPPFSLFREYVTVLMKYKKKFLIIGNINAITYKEFFPLLKDNKVWIGYTNFNVGMYFYVSDDFEYRLTYKFLKEIDGHKVNRVSGCCWFTNLDHTKQHENLVLWKKYSSEEYPKYDNYDAINVDKVSDIPVDYNGIMGVPISYLNHHNPDQFEILGMGCGWNGNSDMLLKTYNSNQIQHTWNKKTKSFKTPIKVGKLNDGTPAIHLEKPYTDDTYYEVDGEYYTRTYGRIFIHKKTDT